MTDRDVFQAWVYSQYYERSGEYYERIFSRNAYGHYVNCRIEDMWCAWQASRKAQEQGL